MKTREMLDKMPSKNRKYLDDLREHIRQAKAKGLDSYVQEHKATGRGYIKALVDCGVIDDFKTAWCWFTL